jgi:hypothetical protein
VITCRDRKNNEQGFDYTWLMIRQKINIIWLVRSIDGPPFEQLARGHPTCDLETVGRCTLCDKVFRYANVEVEQRASDSD